MTGDSQSNDDAELFDDDFIVEESLRMDGDIGEAAVPGSSSKESDAAEELSLDEDGTVDDCRGHRHVESVGVPESTLDSEEDAADPRILDAKKNFATELSALLQDDEDFESGSGLGLDSEVDDGVAEFLDLGPFVLDDDARLCSEEFDAEVSCDGAVADSQEQDVFVVAAAGPLALDDDVASLFSLGEKTDPIASVDSLHDRGDLGAPDHGDGGANLGSDEVSDLGAVHDDGIEEDGEKDSHDTALGGAALRVRLLVAVAATLLIVSGVVATILHPTWLGGSREPERIAKMAVGRPQVVIAAVEPPALLVASAIVPNGAHPLVSKAGAKNEQPEAIPQTFADLGEIRLVPKNANPAEFGTPKVGPAGSRQDSAEGTFFGSESLGANDKVEGVGDDKAQDVAVAKIDVSHGAVVVAEQGVSPVVDPAPLMRFGEDLFVGDVKHEAFSGRVIDGVMPGSRAFAQLHNGNYFVGRVKHVAEEAVTLRVDNGEVTLLMDDIAKLTRLGSADYADLQKTTKGFVRLTNRNRLDGGILSRVAGDHVVLESRNNRVMLPRSVVGEVVSQDGEDGNVRLGTTTEEEGFIRNLAKRQLRLRSGQSAPGSVGGSKPAVGGIQHR